MPSSNAANGGVLMSDRQRLRAVWSRPLALALTLAGLIAPLIMSGPARAANIFDDDWTPPKRAEAPAAPAVKPPEAPSPAAPDPVAKPPAAPPETITPPPNPLSNSAPRARLPLPDKANTARCRKLFKEVFAEQLKDHSVPARRKLAQSLLDYAAKTKDAPADVFVLLTGAFEAAEEGTSLRLSFTAAEKLAEAFDVDESATKIEAATKLWSASAAAPTSVANVQATIDLVDRLASEDDFATAMRVESSLQHVAPRIADAELKSAVQNHVKDLGALREAQSKLSTSEEKLKASPDDPAANSMVGGYFCFTKGQWEKGLPFLAKGQDAALKSLASMELRKPEGAEAAAKMADNWWDAAAKMQGAKRTRTLQHAAVLYRGALADLTGLRQIAIQKRLAEAPSAGDIRRIDLLDLLDVTSDTVKGTWHLDDGVLTSEASSNSRVEFPYAPPEEYDFRIGFVIAKGDQGPEQICACAGHQFLWINGAFGNTICGFDLIQGKPVIDNQTAKRAKRWFTNGQRYLSVVKVRKGGIEAYINDKLVSGWKTDYSDMSLFDGWKIRQGDTVGLGAIDSVIKCDFAEVIEITGQGKCLRP
jgi:hypothetical protein